MCRHNILQRITITKAYLTTNIRILSVILVYKEPLTLCSNFAAIVVMNLNRILYGCAKGAYCWKVDRVSRETMLDISGVGGALVTAAAPGRGGKTKRFCQKYVTLMYINPGMIYTGGICKI